MATLLGPDQAEVQRQALISLATLAAADDAVLQPHLAALLPSICSISSGTPAARCGARQSSC